MDIDGLIYGICILFVYLAFKTLIYMLLNEINLMYN